MMDKKASNTPRSSTISTSRRSFLIGISSLGFTRAVRQTESPQSGKSWPMQHYDSSNTNNATNVGPLGDLSIAWTFEEEVYSESSLALSDGELFFVSTSEAGKTGDCYALDSESGEEIWSYELSETGPCTPIVTEDRVYITDTNLNIENPKGIISLRRSDGSVEWTTQSGNYGILSMSEDTLYVPEESSLLAVNKNSGEIRWKFTPKAENISLSAAPGINNDTVYITLSQDDLSDNMDGGHELLCAVDTESGSKIWERSFRNKWTNTVTGYVNSPITLSDTVLLSVGPALYSISAETGELVWEYNPPKLDNPEATEIKAIAVWENLVISSSDVGFTAIDTANGEVVWQQETNSYDNYPPAISNGYVYAGTGSNEHSVIVLDAESGDKVGQYVPESDSRWSEITYPAIHNGKVYVANQFARDAAIFALEGESVSEDPVTTQPAENQTNVSEKGDPDLTIFDQLHDRNLSIGVAGAGLTGGLVIGAYRWLNRNENR